MSRSIADEELEEIKKEGIDSPADSPVSVEKNTPAERRVKRLRRLKWAGAIVVVLVVASAVSWYFRLYQPLLDRYNSATVVLEVREDNKFSLEGVKLVLAGKEYVTDQNGKIFLNSLVAGTYSLTLSKAGYTQKTDSLTVHRGENNLLYFSLSKEATKVYTITGKVTDYISGQAVAGVQVTLGNITSETSSEGSYKFEKIAAGAGKLTFVKANYATKILSYTVDKADIVADTLPLLPTGKIVYPSGAQGSRILLQAALDGSDPEQFAGVKDGEDFAPYYSPDGKSIAFSSTRDGAKTADGTIVPRLYVVNSDGGQLQKMSNDISTSYFQPVWSPDSKWIFYKGQADGNDTYKVFGLAKKNIIDIGEIATNPVFSADGAVLAYAAQANEDQSTTVTAEDGTSTTTVTQVPTYTLKTINLNNGERKTFTKRKEAMSRLVFAKDGKSVSYDASIDGTLKRLQVVVASGVETETTAITTPIRQYVMSPAGDVQVFIEKRDDKTDLYAVNAAGQQEKTLTKLGSLSNNYLPVWDASGRYVFFVNQDAGGDALYGVSPGGGDVKKIEVKLYLGS